MLGLRQLVIVDLIRGRGAHVQGAASPKGDVKPDFVGFGPPRSTSPTGPQRPNVSRPEKDRSCGGGPFFLKDVLRGQGNRRRT